MTMARQKGTLQRSLRCSGGVGKESWPLPDGTTLNFILDILHLGCREKNAAQDGKQAVCHVVLELRDSGSTELHCVEL